jgi:hypothetical protein
VVFKELRHRPWWLPHWVSKLRDAFDLLAIQQKSPWEGSQGPWPHSAPHPKDEPSGRGYQPLARRFQGEPHRHTQII